MDWRDVLKWIHGIASAAPWLLVWWIREPYWILICICITILLMTQWLVLGRCILNAIENNDGSTESEMMVYLSSLLQIPLESIKNGYILTNFVSPMFAHFSRLCRYFGI
jgi:hypothetical protein